MDMENKKRFTKKRVIMLALVLAMLLSFGLTFAYWYANADTKEVNQPIELGEGIEVTLDVELTDGLDGKKLVPTGMTEYSVGGAAVNTEQIVLVYELTHVVNDPNADIVYTVNVTDESTPLLVVDATLVDNIVTVTITLDEPADKAEYDQLQADGLSFKITFGITATP